MVDVDAFGPGPWGMARLCEAKIAELQTEMATADPARLKAIRAHIKLNRQLLKWAKTRVGYIDPNRPTGQRSTCAE